LVFNPRAEIASDAYMTVSHSVLENIVIIKKNPNYVEEESGRKKLT